MLPLGSRKPRIRAGFFYIPTSNFEPDSAHAFLTDDAGGVDK